MKRLTTLLSVAVLFGAYLGQAHAERAPIDSLHAFIAQYGAIDSVTMTARANVHIDGSKNQVGTLQIEYWAAGVQYRLNTRTSPALGLMSDTDIAYDGTSHYLWLQESNVLSVGNRDSAAPASAMDNPFFLPASFLRSASPITGLPDRATLDSVVHNMDRLKDMRFNQKGGFFSLSTEASSDNVEGYQVLTKAEDDSLHVPIEIRHQDANGKTIGLLRFSDYERVGPKALVFPKNISMRAFDEFGDVLMRTEILITSLELDNPIDAARFTVAGDENTVVWGSDEQRFLED